VKKIMIDPGHNGDKDPGAIGPTGAHESIITLAVAKQVAEILKPVAEVRLTRDSDIALGASQSADLTARANLANAWGADCFVSIHCNAAENRAAVGTEVFCYTLKGSGYELAKTVHDCMVPSLGLIDRGVKAANFAVVRQTKMPACLVELAFISNATEEARLESSAFQRRAARAIAKGVAGYLGLQLPDAVPAREPENVFDSVPAWARTALKWAFNAKIITDPRGSEDFYRGIVALYQYDKLNK
jgi:N-acetylmuramoyl-L-alanine amidase